MEEKETAEVPEVSEEIQPKKPVARRVRKPPEPKRRAKSQGGDRQEDSRTARLVPLVVQHTLLGKDAQEIADLAETSRANVYKIRTKEAYKIALREAVAEQEQVFKDRLRALRDVALKTHLRVMTRSTKDSEALAAAISIFDRVGIPRLTKVEQAGEVRVTNAIDMTPFEGRPEAELIHYVENGVFPDGTKPVAR